MPLLELLADTIAIPSRSSFSSERENLLPKDHPVLRVFELREAIAISSEKLIALEGKPDFGVGLDYVFTNELDVLCPSGNGRDAIVPGAGIRIPLSQKIYTSRRETERLRILQLTSLREDARNRLLALAEGSYVKLDQAQIAYKSANRQSQIIDATLRLATTEYAEGQRAFDELIRLQEQLINLQLERIEAAQQILLARAQLIKILAL